MAKISDDPDLDAFGQRVFRAAEKSIEWSTAPICHYYEGKVCEIRTGILLQIADERYMITAAHGMIEHCDAGRAPHIIMPQKELPAVSLQGELFYSTKDPREDISLARLLDSTVAALGDHYRYLRLNSLMSQNNPLHETSLYLLMGFPRDMVRQEDSATKRADTWKYLTCPYEQLENVETYDPALHIVLDYNRDTKNAMGERVYPKGMSGCGIWSIGNPVSHPLFGEDDFKLVGIQNAWHKGLEYAMGTWSDVVLEIIWKYYSDSRAPMRLLGIEF